MKNYEDGLFWNRYNSPVFPAESLSSVQCAALKEYYKSLETVTHIAGICYIVFSLFLSLLLVEYKES